MSNEPSGYNVLAEFLHEMRLGVVPRTQTTASIAAAFVKVLSGADADDALRLKRGRGQKKMRTARAFAEKREPIWRFIALHVKKHGGKRGALASAKRAAAVRFRKDPRTIDRNWKAFEPWKLMEEAVRSGAYAQWLNLPGRTGSKFFPTRRRMTASK
jgi:hypothetical protein